MKKFLKFSLLTLFIGLLLGFLAYRYLSQSMPEGVTGQPAEELADKMLSSLNYEGYQDLKEISWTFRGTNNYVWKKVEKTVLVEIDNAIIQLDFRTGNHLILKSNEASDKDLIDTAIANFYNDSFWLVAPFKIRDKGTTRTFVETEDGPGLLVTYNSGGVTPGDSYLWVLDENFRPKYWRFWTQIVPVPGMKFKWKGWRQHKGVWFASNHPGQLPVSVNITNLKVK